MNIGGCQKISLVDYPDKIATIVFTNGCVFRCSFCYNPGLVKQPYQNSITEDSFFNFLKSRQNLLEAVVITGGEPTMHPDLLTFIKKIKDLNFFVKLDTCGYLPQALEKILNANLVDYLAMDIKAPLSKYSEIVNIPVNGEKIKISINLIMNSGVPYEFRSTLIGGFHNEDDVVSMAKLVKGADKYYLQRFHNDSPVMDQSFQNKTSLDEVTLQSAQKQCLNYVKFCQIR